MGETDTISLGDKPEKASVAVKTPGAALLHEFQPGFVMPIKQKVCYTASWILIGQLKGFRPEPLYTDDINETVWKNTPDNGIGLEVFEFEHFSIPTIGDFFK